MIIYGLTGSIAMGKSTAARMIRRMGIPVHDSDACVRKLLTTKGEALIAVRKNFPKAATGKGIERKVLADIIFKDQQKRKILESILHPFVRQSQTEFIQNQYKMGMKKVVLDIPLLFETGADKRVDYTIVVTAPAFLQARRALARKGMTKDRFRAILKSQLPDVEKRARADFVVQTGLGRGYTYRKLKEILK